MSEMQVAVAQQLPDFVDLEFARRLEMAETILPNCLEALQRHNPATPCEAEEVAGGVAFFGGKDYPSNQMVGMGLYGEVTALDMDRVEALLPQPGRAVDRRGLAACRHVAAGVAWRTRLPYCRVQFCFDSADQRGGAVHRACGNRHRTRSRQNVSSWTHTLAKGFSQEVTVGEDVFGGFATLPGALAFLARIDGEAAGGCAGRIIPEARIAALFGASTLPEFRGRGVQSALIALRLHEASKAACEYAVVSANPGSGSQRNMERRGFRVAYTKLVMRREWPGCAAGVMP